MPHAIEDTEGDRQAQAQHPGEIPHLGVPISIEVRVGCNGGTGHPARKHAEDPGRVEEDDRQQDNRHQQHEEQRLLGRAVTGIRTSWHIKNDRNISTELA